MSVPWHLAKVKEGLKSVEDPAIHEVLLNLSQALDQINMRITVLHTHLVELRRRSEK